MPAGAEKHSYAFMIKDAIQSSDSIKGASRPAIKAHLKKKYKLDAADASVNSHIKRAIDYGLEKNELAWYQGAAGGHLKMTADSKKKFAKEEAAPVKTAAAPKKAPAKAKATKKTTANKKAPAAKKPTSSTTKKATKTNVAKKTPAKKTAAKAPAKKAASTKTKAAPATKAKKVPAKKTTKAATKK